jgi:hypothetical protein
LVLNAPNCGLDLSKFEEEKMQALRKLAADAPDTEVLPYTPSQNEWLKSYYEDEYQYKGATKAGTLINALIDLAVEGMKYASYLTIPVHVSLGEHENIVSPANVKEFY